MPASEAVMAWAALGTSAVAARAPERAIVRIFMTARTPPALQPCANSHAAARSDVQHRAQEQLEVVPERPVGYVEVIDADHLVHRHPGGAEDLPRAGHPRR